MGDLAAVVRTKTSRSLTAEPSRGWTMVHDRVRCSSMQEIPISKFKATCLEVLENVRKTGRPVRITRFGKPVAQVVAVPPAPSGSWLGCMAGTCEIVGDIVAPACEPEEREALRD